MKSNKIQWCDYEPDEHELDEPQQYLLPTVGADVPTFGYAASETGTAIGFPKVAPTIEQLINDFVVLITSLFESDPELRSRFEETVPNLCTGSQTSMTLEELIISNITQGSVKPPAGKDAVKSYWRVVQAMHTAILHAKGGEAQAQYRFLGQLRFLLNKVFEITSITPPGEAGTSEDGAIPLGEVKDLASTLNEHLHRNKRNPLGHLAPYVLDVPFTIGGKKLAIRPGTTRILVEKDREPRARTGYRNLALFDICVPSSAIGSSVKMSCLLNDVTIGSESNSWTAARESSTEQLCGGTTLPSEWDAWLDGKRLNEWTSQGWVDLIRERTTLTIKVQRLLNPKDLKAQSPGLLPWKQPALDVNSIVHVYQLSLIHI